MGLPVEITAQGPAVRSTDVAPAASKWQRLEAALQTRQQRDGASSCLIRFITDAMEPSRYVSDPGIATTPRSSSLHTTTRDRRHIPSLAKFLTTQIEKNWVTR
jgi:hypothetical protein